MPERQIILDTETTGIRVDDGHRVIEIGCLEMIDRKLTGESFHYYLNPEREIDAGALAVHGIDQNFLKDKPLFKEVAYEFINFVSGAELIIHNAPFDLAFLNNELVLLQQSFKMLHEYCSIIDTLQIARKLHVGQKNTLDALCKRYGIDNSKRDLHGALLDANLLAYVYLAMTGGQGSFFDVMVKDQSTELQSRSSVGESAFQKHKLTVLTADNNELIQHNVYLKELKAQGKCIWLEKNNSTTLKNIDK